MSRGGLVRGTDRGDTVQRFDEAYFFWRPG